jgi:Sulfotransferase domain
MTLNVTTPLLIIGAALPRTSIISVATALEELGYKVFHPSMMTESFHSIWEGICEAESENDGERFDLAFGHFVQKLSDEGFNATLDQPSCFVYNQLMEYYPNAKVLLTLKDASSWAQSMVELTYSTDLYYWQPPFNMAWNDTKDPFGYWSKQKLGFNDREIHPNGVPQNSNTYNHLERKSSISMASCKIAYLRYTAEVRSKVPADKLVPFHPDQEWGPLCEHFLPDGQTCPTGKKFPQEDAKQDGSLVDLRKASARVHLQKVIPVLSNQKWLVNTVAYGMKQRRSVLNVVRKILPKPKKGTTATRK